MSRKILSSTTLLVLLAGLVGIALVLYAWRLPPFTSSIETTDNAYVRGAVTTMSPQVSGYIVEVPVKADGRALWDGIVGAFGPADRGGLQLTATSGRFAGALWERLPSRAQRRMQHGGLLGDRLRWGVATPILQRAKLRKRKHMPPQTRG